MEKKNLGFCKECGEEIFEEHEIHNGGIYECPECEYPSAKADLWEEKPDYLIGL